MGICPTIIKNGSHLQNQLLKPLLHSNSPIQHQGQCRIHSIVEWISKWVVMENDSNIKQTVTNAKFAQILSHKKTKQNLIEQANGVVYDTLEHWAWGLGQIRYCLLSGLVYILFTIMPKNQLVVLWSRRMRHTKNPNKIFFFPPFISLMSHSICQYYKLATEYLCNLLFSLLAFGILLQWESNTSLEHSLLN